MKRDGLHRPRLKQGKPTARAQLMILLSMIPPNPQSTGMIASGQAR